VKLERVRAGCGWEGETRLSGLLLGDLRMATGAL
jgi:hypothetical protein